MKANNSLPKSKRLNDKKAISAVFDNANAVRHPVLILLGRANGLHYPRLAIIVAKKNVKKAHDRNRLKRLIRESFRCHQNQQALMGHDIVVLVKSGMNSEENLNIWAILEKQWQRYQKRYVQSA